MRGRIRARALTAAARLGWQVCDYYTAGAATAFFAAPCLCRFLAVFRVTTAALALPTAPAGRLALPRAFDCVRCSPAAGACPAGVWSCPAAAAVWHPFAAPGAAYGAPSWPAVTAAAEPATRPENGWWTQEHVLSPAQAAAGGTAAVRGTGSCEALRTCWRDLGLGTGNYSVGRGGSRQGDVKGTAAPQGGQSHAGLAAGYDSDGCLGDGTAPDGARGPGPPSARGPRDTGRGGSTLSRVQVGGV